MNGFIEVHVFAPAEDDDEKCLINTDHIQEVREFYKRAVIYFDFQNRLCDEQDFIQTREKYEEVKHLIEEATK